MSRTLPEVVRLRPAPVTEFNRILRQIEEGSPFNARFYEPTHQCVREYHLAGNTQILQQQITKLDREAASAHGRDRIKPTSNREVLEIYRDHFASPYRPIAPGIPPRFRSLSFVVGDLTIIGKPHIAVEARGGRTHYIYLVTSKEWAESDVRFGINLLSEIVTANLPGTSHADVEALNCRTGTRIVGHPLSNRDRNALEQLAELLVERGLN